MMSMGTQLDRVLGVEDLTVRGGTAYGIPGVSIDGNDIELMARTTREAANRARAGEGPTFIEAQTYRFKGHSISDPAKYRTQGRARRGQGTRPDRRFTRTFSRSAAGSTTPGRSSGCATRSSTRSTRASSSPSRARAAAEALYEDITVAPYIPQE